jgi:hypothetical protein
MKFISLNCPKWKDMHEAFLWGGYFGGQILDKVSLLPSSKEIVTSFHHICKLSNPKDPADEALV